MTSDDYEAFARIACEGIASSRVPKGQYAALLIDEAHDLADEWLAAAAQMVDPATRSLLVLYDVAQSIYQKSRRKLSFARLGIEAKGRTEILKINYRKTTEVLALAMECAEGVLQDGRDTAEEDMPLVMPQSAGRSGPLPTFQRFDGGLQEAAYGLARFDLAVVPHPRDGAAGVRQHGARRASVQFVLPAVARGP